MSFKAKLVYCLQDLKNVDYTNRDHARIGNGLAERALYLIYQIGLEEINFTDNEKNFLGPLLAIAIKPIKINIERTACVYRTRLNNAVLIKRSALQFLIDNYGQLTVGFSNLTKLLQDTDIQKSIEILDDLINDLKDLSDSDESSSDRETVGCKKLPPSHIWWTY